MTEITRRVTLSTQSQWLLRKNVKADIDKCIILQASLIVRTQSECDNKSINKTSILRAKGRG